MTTATQPAGAAGRASSSSLADVVDTILDKGLIMDAYVRVSLVGIELLTIDARIAEAVNRLDISESDPKAGLPEIVGDVTEGVAKHKAKGALDSAGEKLSNLLSGDQPQRQKSPHRPQRRSRRRTS
jgi:hypothetical protein